MANRKSVAWHIGRVLTEAGARCVYVVQNDQVRDGVTKLLGQAEVFVCDVEHEEQIAAVARPPGRRRGQIPRPGPLDRLCRLFRRAEAVP